MALLRQNAGLVSVLGKALRRHYSSPAKVKLNLRGIFPPITTPFNKDESVAFDKLCENLQKWERHPFRGYVVQGSNGEYPMLTKEERIQMVKCVRQMVPKEKLVIAGSSCESTLLTIEMSEAMAEAGADAVMVINPSYYKNSMTFQSYLQHYQTIADECPVPVIIYNMPVNTGMDLHYTLLIQLSKHPNIIGMKESGSDIIKMSRVIQETLENDFQVVAGSAGILLPSMLIGVVGGIVGMANILGAEVCELHALASKGRFPEAISLHHKLLTPNSLVTRELGVPAMKAAMDRVGLYGGPCRRPLLPLSENEVKRIVDAFQNAGYPLSPDIFKISCTPGWEYGQNKKREERV